MLVRTLFFNRFLLFKCSHCYEKRNGSLKQHFNEQIMFERKFPFMLVFYLSNFISALIFGAICTLNIDSIPGFELSVGTILLIVFLSFILFCICSIPIWLIFNVQLKHKKYSFWKFNGLFLFITLPILFLFQELLWKDFSDTSAVLCSFEICTIISLNIRRKMN